MYSEAARSKGGQVTAQKQREAALARYYSSPNYCKCCNSVIEVREGQKIGEVRAKQFCTQTCSARHNNKIRKRKTVQRKCKTCDNLVRDRRKYCSACTKSLRASKIHLHTKATLIGQRNGYQSYRSSVQHHAKLIYRQSGREYICSNCGYDKHVEICHIISVSNFDASTTVEEINRIENLTALCPNCHWEFDNNLLEIKNDS